MTCSLPRTFAVLAAILLAAYNAAAAQDSAPADAAADVSRARIDGDVVDEAGKPVAGAVVTTFGRKSVPTTRTAADGSFRLVLDETFTRIPAVVASADNGAQQGIGSFEHPVLHLVAKLRVVVKRARTMNVRVTDAAKNPVGGAAVGVMDNSLRIVAQAETDARGDAALRFPADARVLHVIALKPGVGFDYYENYRSSPAIVLGPPPPQVTLTLDGARSIAVRAVDAAAGPVAGIELLPLTLRKKGKLDRINLSCATELKYVSARTNGDGLAAFDWIPPLWLDGVAFLQSSADYSLPVLPNLKPADLEQTLVARLLRNVAISGKATFPDGKPAAGILLQVQGRGDTSRYFRGFVRTRADGSYKLLVDPNLSYIIAVNDAEWAAPSHKGIVIDDSEPRKDFDFRLDRGILVHGKITVGEDKKPAAKQRITLAESWTYSSDERGGVRDSLLRSAETDNDGRYSICVAPGRYALAGPGGTFEREFTLKAGEPMERDFHVHQVDREDRKVFKGVVVADTFDGKPVACAVLQWNLVFGNAVADDQGRFEFHRLPDNDRFMYARNREGTLATINRIGVDDDEIKITIGKAGKLRGRLVDKAGKAVVGVRIQCGMIIGPQENPHARASLLTQTDDAGRFAFPGIVAGARCEVFAYGAEDTQTLRVLPLVQAESVDLGDLTFDP
jgi:hypothetical protein